MKTYKGFSIGQNVTVKNATPNSAIIIGFGINNVFLLDINLIKYSIAYSEIY
jgi:hypothetical protein